ncbi:MAG: hypothetical protein ACYTJ0_16860 [Planctomycetota bacterium]|jgi:hypothetical protein
MERPADGFYPPTVGPPIPAPGHPGGRPAVWTWFVVYCVFMALLYVLVMGVGVVLLLVDPVELEMDSMEATIMGSAYAALGAVLAVPYAVAPFLPPRRWVWIGDLVLICLGMTSCCTLPACIPLLIFWIKPETKAHFGWL